MRLEAEIREMIARVLDVEAGEVRPDAHLEEDLGADSLALIDLAEAIGVRFGTEADADDLADLGTVGSVVAWVAKRIASPD